MNKCNKVPFISRREARAARDGGKYGKPYRCPYCGEWHLGHAIPKKNKASIAYLKAKRSMKEFMDMIDIIFGVKSWN